MMTQKRQRTSNKKKAAEARPEAEVHLNNIELHELAHLEVEYLQESAQQHYALQEAQLDDIRADVEEAECQIADVKRDTYEFRRDVVLGGTCPRTQKIMAEKVVKYLEDHLRGKGGLIEKLRLKSQALRASITRLSAQARQKEQLGEVLHVVDFEQLKIENQQYLERIEEKNAELLKFKLTTGTTVQRLNVLKSELSAVLERGAGVGRDIREKEASLEVFEDDFVQATSERDAAKAQLRKLKLEQEDVNQPQILEYIHLKAGVQELAQKLVDWKRKVEIADLDLQRCSTLYRTLTAPHTPSKAA